MPSLLDPLPDEVQQIVEIVAEAYGWNGKWPVWQFVAQQAYGKFGIDADAALLNQPQWQVPQWTTGYQAVRTVPAAAGNSLPDIEARTVLTAYGLLYASQEASQLLLKAILKAIEIGANKQSGVTLSPNKVTQIAIQGTELAGAVNEGISASFSAKTLGLILLGEPPTVGGGVHESDDWTWNLTQHRQLRTFVSDTARDYLVKLNSVLGAQSPQPFTAVSPDALPRALDHLNVVWKAVTKQRLFYPRGLASAASLVEPVISGDQLTARLGALADVFDLFLRTPTGGAPAGGSLTAFGKQVVELLETDPAKDQAGAAVGRLVDITRIRNGRLHTHASNWAESLHRLGVPASDAPTQQWEHIRSVTVEAVYGIIELLQPFIS
jgi:hypothetical protein